MIRNKYIKKLSGYPVVGAAIKKGISILIKREAQQISQHFSLYLKPVVAFKPETIQEGFKIRHDVYCEELKFEPVKDSGMEQDEFDEYSRFCLIEHKPSSNFAGCVRIVSPSDEGQLLPIEKYCAHALEGAELHPSQFDRSTICEISRLAVRPQYRRRKADNFEGAASGAINEETYSENELRCFPFLAIGLYLSVASLAIRNNINHAFVMMEPRLARSMSFLGIKFQQLGPAVDYHGKRAPYYISARTLVRTLPIGFQTLMKDIDKEVEKGCLAARRYSDSDKYTQKMYKSFRRPINNNPHQLMLLQSASEWS